MQLLLKLRWIQFNHVARSKARNWKIIVFSWLAVYPAENSAVKWKNEYERVPVNVCSFLLGAEAYVGRNVSRVLSYHGNCMKQEWRTEKGEERWEPQRVVKENSWPSVSPLLSFVILHLPCPVQQHLTVDPSHLLETLFLRWFPGHHTLLSFLCLISQTGSIVSTGCFSFVQPVTWRALEFHPWASHLSTPPHFPSDLLGLNTGLSKFICPCQASYFLIHICSCLLKCMMASQI